MGDHLYKKKGGTVWYGYYWGPDGQRRYVCTKQTDKAAARAALREIEREAFGAPGSKRAQGETGHSVHDALQHFLDVGCVDVAPATKGMYTQQSGHLVRLLGELDVAKLKLDDVHDYVKQRLKEGAQRETIRKELVGLRRALVLAHQRGIIAHDPRGLIPRLKVRYVPKDRFLSPAEFELLMRTLPPARRLWVGIAVFTGARLSEVEGIQWETVDLANRRLLLPGTKTHKSRRWVPIAEPLVELLEQIHPDARHGHVVPKWENARRDLTTFVRAHNRAQKKAALAEKRQAPVPMRNISPNDLRRTFASWLKQAGVDSMAVAKMLGHTSSRMVEMVYGHLNDATMQAAIEKLPTPTTPTLAQPGTSSADPKKPRRRFGIPTQVTTPPLLLVDELQPLTTDVLPPEESKPEQIPAWRARGRVHARSGSQSVVKPGRLERIEKPLRQRASQSSSELVVPRVGIEPTTRGFSVRCSTN